MTDARDRGWEVERYEQLRADALQGGPSGFRLGLALLERRGVAAWTRAWRDTTPQAVPQSPAPVVELPAASGELVNALAGLALARVAAG
jgi:hypothetical protein